MAVRHEAKEGQTDAWPQALNNRKPIRWNTVRIFQGREQSRRRGIIPHRRTVAVGQAPGKEEEVEEAPENHPTQQRIEPQQGCPLKVQGL